MTSAFEWNWWIVSFIKETELDTYVTLLTNIPAEVQSFSAYKRKMGFENVTVVNNFRLPVLLTLHGQRKLSCTRFGVLKKNVNFRIGFLFLLTVKYWHISVNIKFGNSQSLTSTRTATKDLKKKTAKILKKCPAKSQ